MATLSEGLGWQKTLSTRRAELTRLRDASATRQFRSQNYGATAAEGTVVEPVYNAQELDRKIARIAREERLLDVAIKRANAVTQIEFEINDEVLGELV